MVKPAAASPIRPAGATRVDQNSSDAPAAGSITVEERVNTAAANGLLAEGAAGPEVLSLQKSLLAAGFDPGPLDGRFGPRTRKALEEFQRRAKLKPDGLVGSKTRDRLATAPQPADFKPSGETGKTELLPPAGPAPRAVPRPPKPTAKEAVTDPTKALKEAPLAFLSAINPMEALKLVRDGDVDITIPVKAGDVVPGKLKAKQNTSVHLVMKVKDGNIDFGKTKVTFEPPMTGPLGTVIEGIGMRQDGRAEIEVKYLFNATVGEPGSPKLTDFIDRLGSGALPVKWLGMAVGEIALGGAEPIDYKAVAQRIDIPNAKIDISNVSFQNGEVPFGSSGSAKLGPASKVKISGTLADLRITGHADLVDFNINAEGTVIKGGKGTADLDVHFTSDPSLKGRVDTKIKNLNLNAEYAIGIRENGDFLELAKGKIENATVSVNQALGVPDAKPTSHLNIGNFDGTVSRGRITIKDGNGSARVNLGRTQVKGAVEVNGKHVLLSGDVDLIAQVDEYDTPGDSATLKLTDAKLQGKGHAVFDSDTGVVVEGEVDLKTRIESGRVNAGKGTASTVDSKVVGGTLDAKVTRFSLGVGPEGKLDGKVDIQGTATSVDLGFQGLDIGTKVGVALKGGAGRVTGSADLNLTNSGIGLSNGKLRFKGAVQDGKVNLGTNIALDIKAGSTVDAVMTRAIFADDSEFDMSSLKVDATLDSASVSLPGHDTLRFNDGAKLKLVLDRLQVAKEGGTPTASGSLELQASVNSKQIDLQALAKLPGVALTGFDGLDQNFKLKLGRFSIERNGTFDVKNVAFNLEATIRHFGGKILN